MSIIGKRSSADAKEAPYVYWLAGPNRTPQYSYVDSRDEFNRRYLAQFGPLFDVAEWLNEYRRDPTKAVARMEHARQLAEMPSEINPPGRSEDAPRDTKGRYLSAAPPKGDNIQCNRWARGNAADYRISKLNERHPDIVARLAAGEFRSVAHAPGASMAS